MTRRGRAGYRSGTGDSLSLFDTPGESAAPPSSMAPGSSSNEELPHPGTPPPMPAVDETPGSSAASAVSVSNLTRTVKDVLEGTFLPLWVRGEVTDFKAHRNGHWYFCLRDKDSQVRCVVWSRDQKRIPASPDDGMELSAFGQVTVWPVRGDLQFVVKGMEAQGDGLWRKALELSIARLTEEGLLAPERKRAIPRHPRRVAIVTSPSGAALHDIVAVARRRAPHVELVLVPAKVQGEGAAAELRAALELVARWGKADVVIVGRGGGGREDLWAFNDENLARTVAGMPMPVISAVGHEIDTTLCDLAADLRAPTPSAAAEAAVPELAAVRAELERWHRRVQVSVAGRVGVAADRRTRVARRMSDALSRLAERRRASLEAVSARLHALSPLATLARGYAVARDPNGKMLSSVDHFTPDSPFTLLLRDGSVAARAIAATRNAAQEEDS